LAVGACENASFTSWTQVAAQLLMVFVADADRQRKGSGASYWHGLETEGAGGLLTSRHGDGKGRRHRDEDYVFESLVTDVIYVLIYLFFDKNLFIFQKFVIFKYMFYSKSFVFIFTVFIFYWFFFHMEKFLFLYW
jgi:hypothetical protein